MRKFTSWTPRLESLEHRQMLSATTIETEPNDKSATADVAVFDTVDGAARLEGTIANRKDRDFFRFTAPAAGPLQLAAVGSNGLVAKVHVYNGQGVEIFETEPNDGVNAGSFLVQSGQQYTVRVKSADDTTGNYQVNLTLGDPPVTQPPSGIGNQLAETEPNNRKSQATAADLGSDGLLTLQGVSTDKRDKDFFRFTPATSGNLNITVRADGGQLAKLQIENAAGEDLFETQPNDGVNAGSVAVEGGQTYFVRMRSPNREPAPYLVDLALVQDVTEPSSIEQVARARDNGGAAAVQQIRLQGRLTGTALAAASSGKATFESRSDRIKLSVEVEDLRRVTSVQFWANGAVIGTLPITPLGGADLNLDSRLGHQVPKLSAGTRIEVTDGINGSLLLAGNLG